MLHPSFRAVAPGALALAALLSLLHAPVSTSAAVTVVDNPAPPAAAATVVTPTESWRVGGESEAEGEFFGMVRQAAVDAVGNTYLLDQQLHEIRVFDAQGRFLRSFGRQGEGPGELTNPQDLFVLADGRVGVLHGRPTRFTLFPPDGGMGEDVTIGEGEPFAFSMRVQLAGDRPVVHRAITTMGEGTRTSTQMLVAIDPRTGKHTHTYFEQSETTEQLSTGGRVMIMLTADGIAGWTAGPDGRVYVVRENDRYEIEVYGPDGAHERTIRRAYDRVAKPQTVYEAERDARRQMSERTGQPFDESLISKHYPDIAALYVRPNGELWVLPSSGRRDDDRATLGVFDVFDPQGRWVRQVEVRVPFTRGEDEFTFEGPDLIVFENAVDAMRSGAGGGGMTFVMSGSGPADDDEAEVEPLAIVRYSMP